MKTHYVYKITDPKTKQFYIGSRIAKDCEPDDDDYLGSMKTWTPEDETRLQKEILKVGFDSIGDMLEYEAELIEKYIDNELNENYYIPTKGFHTYGRVLNEDEMKLRRINWTGQNNPNYGGIDDKTKDKISKTMKDYYENNDSPFKGCTHTKETKKKISENRKGKCEGEDHPLLGKNRKDGVKKKISNSVKEWHKNNVNGNSKRVKHIESGMVYESITEAANYFGYIRGTVSSHCNGKRKNKKFKFVNE